jgi:hypothetical protein
VFQGERMTAAALVPSERGGPVTPEDVYVRSAMAAIHDRRPGPGKPRPTPIA